MIINQRFSEAEVPLVLEFYKFEGFSASFYFLLNFADEAQNRSGDKFTRFGLKSAGNWGFWRA